MSKVSVQVEVEKEVYDLLGSVARFVGAVKEALKDGFQPGSDIPAVVLAAYQDLLPAVQLVGQIPGDLMEDKSAFAKAVELGGADIVAAALG
jgi:hypothetical protein